MAVNNRRNERSKNQHQEEPQLKATHTAACGRILHNYVDVDSFQGSASSTMRHYT